jgi:hypothetical protein
MSQDVTNQIRDVSPVASRRLAGPRQLYALRRDCAAIASLRSASGTSILDE